MKKYKICLWLLSTLLFLSCDDEIFDDPGSAEPQDKFMIPYHDKPTHFPGIAIYTADMSKENSTEVNSEFVIRNRPTVNVESELVRNGFNSFLKINFQNFKLSSDYVELVVSVFSKLTQRISAPDELLEGVNGVSFRAVSYDVPIKLRAKALDINNNVIASQLFDIKQDSMRLYDFKFDASNLQQIVFNVNTQDQEVTELSNGALGIDDVYLTNNTSEPFTPPTADSEFLSWLKESSIRFFIWNYRQIDDVRGVVLESSDVVDKVSLSGLGFAYSLFILAEEEGILSPSEAKNRILSILKWQQDQNWFDGSAGWHGIPFHYFNKDGSALWPDVSTIDWAMCAAGIRVVRQRYSNDQEIVSIATELLERTNWQDAIDKTTTNEECFNCRGRIAMGFDGQTGEMNPYRWAFGFSEETELVYLEALASGKVDDEIIDLIIREEKNGYLPSWFGAGFTYNWLQLWAGPQEPYFKNSTAAYLNDFNTCKIEFGRPLMGLTACSTIRSVKANGFLEWTQYISNQGGNVSGASSGDVIQISPAPYGAALGLPFQTSSAITALREYVKLGYYHPLLGLPDNVRINNLPNGLDSPVPNWDPFDINIGPLGMAIEQIEQDLIGNYYMQDTAISTNMTKLINSFNN